MGFKDLAARLIVQRSLSAEELVDSSWANHSPISRPINTPGTFDVT